LKIEAPGALSAGGFDFQLETTAQSTVSDHFADFAFSF